MSSDEKVLCIDSESIDNLFRQLGYSDQEFLPASAFSLREVAKLLNHTLSFIERSKCEDDPGFRQAVTYAILISNAEYDVAEYEIGHYRRGKSGEEGRLHDLRSIGIGGHVSQDDVIEGITSFSLTRAARREVQEEVTFHRLDHESTRYAGLLIVRNGNKVNDVHLGLIFEMIFIHPAKPNEGCIEDLRFCNLYELVEFQNKFDQWNCGGGPNKLKSGTPPAHFEDWSAALIKIMRGPRITFF
jgi:predicted NUDIX family phosphoesterase